MIVDFLTNAQIEHLYLDYVNNFLTIERFAEHYGVTELAANDIVRLGRYLDNR